MERQESDDLRVCRAACVSSRRPVLRASPTLIQYSTNAIRDMDSSGPVQTRSRVVFKGE